MKKTICLMLSILFVCSLCACSGGDPSSSNGRLINEPLYLEVDVGDFEQVAADEALDLDFDALLAQHAAQAYATDTFRAWHGQADEVVILPVYTTYLQPTTLFVSAFYSEETLLGTKTLRYVPDGGNLLEWDDARWSSYYEGLADEAFCEELEKCISQFPTFSIDGAFIDRRESVRLFGILEGEEHASYYQSGALHEFQNAARFATVEEGSEAYETFLKERKEIYSQLPIYGGAEDGAEQQSWINMFYQLYVLKLPLEEQEEYSFLNDADLVISVPLLNASGEENVYRLHLLYRENKLIGELLVKAEATDSPSTKYTVSPALKKVSQKNSKTGEYEGLGQSIYTNRVASLIQNYSGPDAKVVGIKFNGTEFSLATEPVSNEETTTERYEFDTPSSSE